MTSLQGLRVLNTRPIDQASRFSLALKHAGAIPIELPLLTIEPLPSTQWLQKLPDLSQVQKAIFISANAVNYFFIPSVVYRWPNHIHGIAIGDHTATAMAHHGISVEHQPNIADSEHLLDLVCLQSIEQQTILLIKGMGGRPLIEETLKNRGANIVPIEVYQRLLPKRLQVELEDLWHHDAIDMIFITSEQSFHHLFDALGDKAKSWLCRKTFLVQSLRLSKLVASHGAKPVLFFIDQQNNIHLGNTHEE